MVNSQSKLFPREITFRSHTLYPFSKQVDWKQILPSHKQDLIGKAKLKENFKRKLFDCKVNDLILIWNKQRNLEPNTLSIGR